MANPYARTCVVFGAGLLGKSMGAAIGLDAALPLDGLLNAFFSEAEAKEREKARRFSESLAEELAIIGPKAEGTRNAVCLTIETAIQRFPISHRRLVELNLDPDAATAELMPHLAFSTASERTELEPWCKRLIRCFYDELPRHAHILAELLPDLWAVVLKRQHAIKDDTERLLSGQEKMLRQIELLEQDKSIPRLERQTTRLGLTNSAPTFKAGAELLIESYLGSEEKKVPFGGRAWELNTLNDWLDDESAPRRLLVTAPAARGKTALVLRWLDQLDTRWQCVLLPISVRFETNRELDFYQALAGALAAAFGESLPPSSTNPVDFYRGLATVWLRRTEELPRPLLLVVEGLDEAAGWQIPLPLLPHNPPPSLRILVSARLLLDDDGPAGWTGRLAWSEHGASPKVLEIQPLNGEDAIADVLTATGASAERLSKDRTLLSELYRLTLGDPLLLSFYVDDLTRSAKEPGAIDLVRLPALLPGLGGYFKRWLDDQYAQWEKSGVSIDHRMVNTILAILGCAFGPLRHGELAQLYRELAASELGPSSRSLYVLQRFIMGDGRDQGYVLCHPKLATYLRSEHFDDPTFLEQARDAFLDWGRTAVTRANAGETVPAETSPYLPKYFTAHLTEAEPKLADFMLLVENGWRRWRENVDEGTHGFATDVRMVLRRCIDAGAELYRLRCAIVLSSLLSIGQNIPAELLGAAFRHKLMSLEQVLHSARQQELPHRARSLCNIGKHLSGARRAEVFDEALDVVADINKPNSQEEILTLIVPELDERQRQQALSVCQKISGHSARARTLLAIAKFLPPKQKNGAVTNAISSARLIKEDVVSALNLATTLPHVHGAQYNQILGEVQGIAANIDNSRSYLAILAKLMQFLADPEKSAIRKKILKQLQKLEQNPVNEMSFLEVAMNSLDEHFISMALDCLIKLSPNHLSIASIWDMTIHIGKELNDKHIQMILGFLNRSRPIRKINRPIDNELRIRIYCNLIDRIPEAILDQIWALAHSEILHIHSRVDLFRALGLVCDEEKLNWLLECIAGIEDVGSRSHAIAPACSNMTSRQALRALELCQEIGDFNELIIATLVCSKELGDSDFIRAISDTQAHATSISQPYDRAIFLVELATHLEGTLRETLIAEAESAYAVGNTRADHLQAKILVLRAPLLVGASLGKAFEEASKYSAPAHRATVIRALASKLSMEQVESTLRAIDKLEGTYSQPKASTVAALASRLDGDSRDKYMRRALAWANESDDHSRVTAWADLAAAFDDELGPDLRRKSLELAQSLDSPRSQASALSYILPILSVSEAEEALASFMDVAPSLKRDGLLTTIVPFVPYLAQRWGLPAIAELRRAILDCRDWYP